MLRQDPIPLKDRILRSSSVSSPSLVQVSERPIQYKNWSEDRLYKAYKAVQNGHSIRHAANSYNVPKSTLYDRLSGRVQFGTKRKPPRYLTDPEEEELVNFLSGWVALGYACSKRCNCLSSASSGYKGDVESIGDRWMEGIL